MRVFIPKAWELQIWVETVVLPGVGDREEGAEKKGHPMMCFLADPSSCQMPHSWHGSQSRSRRYEQCYGGDYLRCTGGWECDPTAWIKSRDCTCTGLWASKVVYVYELPPNNLTVCCENDWQSNYHRTPSCSASQAMITASTIIIFL